LPARQGVLPSWHRKYMKDNKLLAEDELGYEARFNLLNFFSLLYKIDKRLKSKKADEANKENEK
jgi:hypothetical protein